MVIIDVLHVCDLGITQDLTGNILWELLVELGGTIQKSKPACAKLLAI